MTAKVIVIFGQYFFLFRHIEQRFRIWYRLKKRINISLQALKVCFGRAKHLVCKIIQTNACSIRSLLRILSEKTFCCKQTYSNRSPNN